MFWLLLAISAFINIILIIRLGQLEEKNDELEGVIMKYQAQAILEKERDK